MIGKMMLVEDIISNVEVGIRIVPQVVAHEVSQEAAMNFLRATPPKCNLSAGELHVLKDLREDESILVLPADKGSDTVVLNSENYRKNIRELLGLENYEGLLRDPPQL